MTDSVVTPGAAAYRRDMTTLTDTQAAPSVPTSTDPRAAERAEKLTAAGTAWGERIAADVTKSLLNPSATATAEGLVATRVSAGGHEFLVDEPAGLAGDNTGASPVEYALGALIGCHVVVYRLYAHALGIRVEDITATADGDVDVRKLFGIDESLRAGFSEIRISVTVTGPETAQRYEELKAAVDAHCPILDLFANPTPVVTTVTKG